MYACIIVTVFQFLTLILFQCSRILIDFFLEWFLNKTITKPVYDIVNPLANKLMLMLCNNIHDTFESSLSIFVVRIESRLLLSWVRIESRLLNVRVKTQLECYFGAQLSWAAEINTKKRLSKIKFINTNSNFGQCGWFSDWS